MRNHEVTNPQDLLSEQGTISEPGWARTSVWTYNRKNLPVPHVRMKEWDYYLVMNEQLAVAFTISDLGYLSMASVTFILFEDETQVTRTELSMPGMNYFMEDNPDQGVVEWRNNKLLLRFEMGPGGKHVYCEYKKFYKGSDFKADIWFDHLPAESMNIATPFENSKCFYYNHKMNAMSASGRIVFNWHLYHLDPSHDYGVLDWGRGYWPYKSHWFWGTASGLCQKKPLGINLGYGFGDTEAATENVLLYEGKIHKLDDVAFHIPNDPMKPWTITSSDGRFEALFVPKIDRAAKMDYGVICTDQHQYFGTLSGFCTLDDGRTLELEDFPAALETVYNKY